MTNDPFSKLGALDQKLYQTPKEAPEQASIEVHKPASKQVSKQEHKQVSKQGSGDSVETLFRKMQNNRYLTANTFRFRPEELEELNKLFDKLDKSHPKKVTKNDLMRVALNWLLEDYKNNEGESLLAKILARM